MLPERLEHENEELQRSKKRVQKRLERERLEKRKKGSSNDADVSANLDSDTNEIENRNTNFKSTRKSTTTFLRRLKLTCEGRALLKEIVFAEFLTIVLRTAVRSTDVVEVTILSYQEVQIYSSLRNGNRNYDTKVKEKLSHQKYKNTQCSQERCNFISETRGQHYYRSQQK